jgi:phospholipid-binding lipoprotein MlaA
MSLSKLKIPRFALCVMAGVLLAGCATPMPRKDDPLEKFNRKMFGVNQALDRAFIRPTAVAYRKVTNPGVRRVVADFFTNLQLPVTIVNDVLQARPKAALSSTGRFAVNTTLGLAGLFDPASKMGLALEQEDFGITMAKWGVPEGPYLVLPLLGPTTGRDVARYPVDNLFNPLPKLTIDKDRPLPYFLYLVSLRSRGLDAEGFLSNAYDPYVFTRDAYRQRRLYEIYEGQPPIEVIQSLQGVDDVDVEKLLEEQEKLTPRPKSGSKDSSKKDG